MDQEPFTEKVDLNFRHREKGAETFRLNTRKPRLGVLTLYLLSSASAVAQGFEAERAYQRNVKKQAREAERAARKASKHAKRSAKHARRAEIVAKRAARKDQAESEASGTEMPTRSPKLRSRGRATLAAGAAIFAGAATAQIYLPSIVDHGVFRPIASAVAPMFVQSDLPELEDQLRCIVPLGFKPGDSESVLYIKNPACAGGSPFLAVPFEGEDLKRSRAAFDVLEGPYAASSHETVAGINFVGVGWRGVLSFGASGGSNAATTAFEAIHEIDNPGIWDKFGAMAGTSLLVMNSTEEEIDKLISLTPVCTGRGVRMGGALGGKLCASLMFPGSNGEHLDYWQHCMLAAGAKRPHLITSISATPEQQDAARLRMVIRKSVGRSCTATVAKMVNLSREETLRQLADLDAYQVPTVEAAGRHPNPMRWVHETLPGANENLKDVAKIIGVQPYDAAPVVTTLNSSAQQSVHAIMLRELETKIQPLLSNDVCLQGCEQPINYLVSVAESTHDNDLVIKAHVASDPGQFYGHVYADGSIAPPDRSPGSGVKISTATCAIKYVRNKNSFCSNGRFGLTDRGRPGTDCSQSDHFYTIQEIYGASLNSATAEMAANVPVEELKACHVYLGATVYDGKNRDSMAIASATGSRIIFSPAKIMRLSSAVSVGSASMPVFTDRQFGDPHLDLNDFLTDGQLDRLRSITDAPVTESYGTMAGFSVRGCSTTILKTGSSDSSKEVEVRDKILIWSGECSGGREMTAMVMIGSRSPDLALGQVHSDNLGRILSQAVEATIANTSKTKNG